MFKKSFKSILIVIGIIFVISCSNPSNDVASVTNLNNLSISSKNIAKVSPSGYSFNTSSTNASVSRSLSDSSAYKSILSYEDNEEPDLLRPLIFEDNYGNKAIIAASNGYVMNLFYVDENSFLCEFDRLVVIAREPNLTKYYDSIRRRRYSIEDIEVSTTYETSGNIAYINTSTGRAYIMKDPTGNTSSINFSLDNSKRKGDKAGIAGDNVIIFGQYSNSSQSGLYSFNKNDPTTLQALNDPAVDSIDSFLCDDDIIVAHMSSSTSLNPVIKIFDPKNERRPYEVTDNIKQVLPVYGNEEEVTFYRSTLDTTSTHYDRILNLNNTLYYTANRGVTYKENGENAFKWMLVFYQIKATNPATMEISFANPIECLKDGYNPKPVTLVAQYIDGDTIYAYFASCLFEYHSSDYKADDRMFRVVINKSGESSYIEKVYSYELAISDSLCAAANKDSLYLMTSDKTTIYKYDFTTTSDRVNVTPPNIDKFINTSFSVNEDGTIYYNDYINGSSIGTYKYNPTTDTAATLVSESNLDVTQIIQL